MLLRIEKRHLYLSLAAQYLQYRIFCFLFVFLLYFCILNHIQPFDLIFVESSLLYTVQYAYVYTVVPLQLAVYSTPRKILVSRLDT